MTKFRQEGYTLLELMVVVAIIGILAAFAVPTYFDYIKQAKVAEASLLFDGFKTKVLVFYSLKGAYPTFAELKDDGVTYMGTFVLGSYDDAMASAGTPQVCFKVIGFDAGKDNLCWKYNTSTINPSQKVWHCRRPEVPGTTIEDKFLPMHCKTTSPSL